MDIKELPEGLRDSKYLTENDLLQIAASERFPAEKELFQMRPIPEVVNILNSYGHDFNLFEKEMHLFAKEQIKDGNAWFAFKLLMVVEYTRESLV